ncbi:MAG: DUF3565 domain-containing protein [Gammaproteobacteria bacterium]|nr:DUF3565 domain-containing protein [Gammaproteobacteria bacterium]MDH5659875.1 DUF3565 domain-containing protein [Gammaproteobacteria bacterium]
MKQKIVRFDKDDDGDWFASLSCGHTQHVRHNPPWVNRPWVVHAKSRENYVGTELNCKKCTDLD